MAALAAEGVRLVHQLAGRDELPVWVFEDVAFWAVEAGDHARAGRLLRVEVEHAQSGSRATARGVALGWISAQIADLLGESRAPPDPPASGR